MLDSPGRLKTLSWVIAFGARVITFASIEIFKVLRLKAWTLASMIRTDVTGRALPWGRLILERGAATRDLNLRADQRWSAILTGVALAGVALAPMRPELWAAALCAILTVIVLNRRFYRLLRRQGGFLFTLEAIPLHLLYFLYSGFTFVCVFVESWVRQAAAVILRVGRVVSS